MSFDEREFICVKSGPRDKWRAARAPTSFAMAMRDAVRLPPRTIANCATKTAAFYKFHNHFLTLSPVALPPSDTKTIFPMARPVQPSLDLARFRQRQNGLHFCL